MEMVICWICYFFLAYVVAGYIYVATKYPKLSHTDKRTCFEIFTGDLWRYLKKKATTKKDHFHESVVIDCPNCKGKHLLCKKCNKVYIPEGIPTVRKFDKGVLTCPKDQETIELCTMHGTDYIDVEMPQWPGESIEVVPESELVSKRLIARPWKSPEFGSVRMKSIRIFLRQEYLKHITLPNEFLGAMLVKNGGETKSRLSFWLRVKSDNYSIIPSETCRESNTLCLPAEKSCTQQWDFTRDGVHQCIVKVPFHPGEKEIDVKVEDNHLLKKELSVAELPDIVIGHKDERTSIPPHRRDEIVLKRWAIAVRPGATDGMDELETRFMGALTLKQEGAAVRRVSFWMVPAKSSYHKPTDPATPASLPSWEDMPLVPHCLPTQRHYYKKGNILTLPGIEQVDFTPGVNKLTIQMPFFTGGDECIETTLRNHHFLPRSRLELTPLEDIMICHVDSGPVVLKRWQVTPTCELAHNEIARYLGDVVLEQKGNKARVICCWLLNRDKNS